MSGPRAMSVELAASILGVPVTVTQAELEVAYRRRARESHPDRFADASAERRARATAEFAAVADAFAVLSARPAVPPGRTAAPVYSQPVRPIETPVVIVWCVLLAVGFALTLVGGPAPFGEVERAVRGLVEALAVAIFAFTSRRALLIIGVVLLAVMVVLTLIGPSFGSLIALLATLPASLALIVAGQRRQRSPAN